VVLSPESYNRKVGLALLCPVTSQEKGYPFDVPLPPGDSISGIVLYDQVKSVDWRARGVKFAGTVPPVVMKGISGKLALLIG